MAYYFHKKRGGCCLIKNISLFFDGPHTGKYNNKFDFYSQGNSPRLIEIITKFINSRISEIEHIYGAMYLFNNMHLFELLKKVSTFGAKVDIISIPIEGYDDNKPQKIIDFFTKNTIHASKTKLDLAEDVYNEVLSSPLSNFNLYVFPHMYLRSEYVNPFSRGNMPYSLHIKTFYIKMRDGSSYGISTSSNLAVRDLVKEEMMAIYENSVSEKNASEIFFSELIKQSYLLKNFDSTKDWANLKISKAVPHDKISNSFFAPFFVNSPTIMEDYIGKIIRRGRKRIYIVGQHVCSYQYSFNDNYTTSYNKVNRSGFLSEVLNKPIKMDIKILSQTFVDENGESIDCRAPANKQKFIEFFRAYKQNSVGEYYVNENIHLKFIVVDDYVIISTSNFTPTQFIYIENVDIKSFKEMPGLSYSGTHSEVGQILFLDNKTIADQLCEHFNLLIADSYTKKKL